MLAIYIFTYYREYIVGKHAHREAYSNSFNSDEASGKRVRLRAVCLWPRLRKLFIYVCP